MQHFLRRVAHLLLPNRAAAPAWVILVTFALLINWFSHYPVLVEQYYTYGFYPAWSRVLRFLFGWIPLSVGDLFYGWAIIWLSLGLVRLIRRVRRRKADGAYLGAMFRRVVSGCLLVYVCFNAGWGLNYNRVGIARQLDLDVKQYTAPELDTLTGRLRQQLNEYASRVTKAGRDSIDRKRSLFAQAKDAYDLAAVSYPFLRYPPKSVKPSIFSYAGNYLGFQGYYNPFSGEAQVNTTIPGFMQPFVTTHEMAHQLGYGKENEANFVGFLASRQSSSVILRYSMYFDMFNYAYAELWTRDSTKAKMLADSLAPQVKADIREYRAFRKRYRNPAEEVIMWGYGHFLKANNQPSGKMTYNEVVGWLVAYYKRYGIGAI